MMHWVMKCSSCQNTFSVDITFMEIFRRGDRKGIKTPCPSCGNSSFNRIMRSEGRGGREREY